MQKVKQALFVNLILLLFALFVGVVIAEIILGFFVRTEYHFWEPDPDFQYTFIKNLAVKNNVVKWGNYSTDLSIDSGGFRSQQFDYSKGINTKRVMVLGDSITANIAVPTDKMFTNILSQNLNRKSQFEWEVINRGIEGWGTDNEYVYYVKEGYKYAPDVVVLEFSLNDFDDNFFKNMSFVRNSVLVIKDKFPPFSFMQRVKLYLNARSALYRLIAEFYQRWFENPAGKKIFYFSGRSVGWDDAFNLTTMLVKELKKQVTTNSGIFVVAIVPDSRVVNKVHYDFWSNIHRTYVSQQALIKEIDLFKKYLERNDIQYVDTGGHINDSGDYISVKDGHFSVSGSEKMGNLLYSKLTSFGIVAG